jgi:hypothetical protein
VERTGQPWAAEAALAQVTAAVGADVAAGIDGLAHAGKDNTRTVDLYRHRPPERHLGEASDPPLGHS